MAKRQYMFSPLIIGNLTIDHNITESGRYLGPGGSVYFIAKIFENFGVKRAIISPYGKDFPKKVLKKTQFYPKQSSTDKTLIFKNINGRYVRKQWVEHYSKSFTIPIEKSLSLIKGKIDTVIVAPILNNITKADITKVKKRFKTPLFLLLPQGFFRKIGRLGKILPTDWTEDKEIVPLFEIIIVSENDCKQVVKKAEFWNRLGAIVIVTRGNQGCSLFEKRQRQDFGAGKNKRIVDSTGSGDIFAASFVYAYLQSGNIREAIIFANASASISLRFGANELKYTPEDVRSEIEL